MARNIRIILKRPAADDLTDLVALARASQRFHRPWVYLPVTRTGWRRYLRRVEQGTLIAYLLRRRDTGELVGVANLSEVVRGGFQSAYLGFYAHARHARQGFMAEGLRLILARAFGVHRLHRVEANVQPGNRASLRLVESLGFQREGFSPRYLRIGGRWRDHERWALIREAWRRR